MSHFYRLQTSIHLTLNLLKIGLNYNYANLLRQYSQQIKP